MVSVFDDSSENTEHTKRTYHFHASVPLFEKALLGITKQPAAFRLANSQPGYLVEILMHSWNIHGYFFFILLHSLALKANFGVSTTTSRIITSLCLQAVSHYALLWLRVCDGHVNLLSTNHCWLLHFFFYLSGRKCLQLSSEYDKTSRFKMTAAATAEEQN